MKLTDYLQTIGDKAGAELFGVKRRTVKSWRLGMPPSRTNAEKIIRATGGKVTWADIYEVER